MHVEVREAANSGVDAKGRVTGGAAVGLKTAVNANRLKALLAEKTDLVEAAVTNEKSSIEGVGSMAALEV